MIQPCERNHYCAVIRGSMASQITSLTIVYSIVHSGADQRKHQSPASLAFVSGIHRWPVNSPHKSPVTLKTFPFDNAIMTMKTKGHPSRKPMLEIQFKSQFLCMVKDTLWMDSESKADAQIAKFMGPIWGPPGSDTVGPRWAPCWPNEPCHQGVFFLYIWSAPVFSDFTLYI